MITPAAFTEIRSYDNITQEEKESSPSKHRPQRKAKRGRKKSTPTPVIETDQQAEDTQNVKEELEEERSRYETTDYPELIDKRDSTIDDQEEDNTAADRIPNCLSTCEDTWQADDVDGGNDEANSKGSDHESNDNLNDQDYSTVLQTKATTKDKAEQCPHCTAQFTTKYRLSKHISQTHSNGVQCPHCSESFNKTSELKVHFREQHSTEDFPLTASCDICLELFPSDEVLQEHKRKSHSHPCDFCEQVFFRLPDLETHSAEIHSDAEPVCNICKQQFDSLKSLRKHRKTEHRNKKDIQAKCKECDKICASAYALYLHERAVHKKVGFYTCDQCDKTFTYHNTLKLHKLHHAGERPFKCTFPNCEKTYLSSSHLKGHMGAVHSGKKYLCPVCNKRFPYEHSLKMHMHLHTDQRRFTCSVCSKGFITAAALRNHETLHEPNQPSYACSYCGKTYRTPGQLRGHERRHTDDRNRYMCHVCGCTFMYRSNLEAHALVHRADRTFQCNQCTKSFRTYATLYSHAKCHQKEKPFMCEICAKGFKTKEILKRHCQRHTGEKPFKCTLCKSCFPDKGGLSKHLKTVHTSKPNFQCPACKKTCSRADNLRVHMKSHNDPELLKLSREELMIEKEDQDGDSSRIDMAQVLLQSSIVDATPSIVTQAPAPSICSISQSNHTLQQQQQQQQQQYSITQPGTTIQSSQATDLSITVADPTLPGGGGMIALPLGFSHNLYMMETNTPTMDNSVGHYQHQGSMG